MTKTSVAASANGWATGRYLQLANMLREADVGAKCVHENTPAEEPDETFHTVRRQE